MQIAHAFCRGTLKTNGHSGTVSLFSLRNKDVG